MLFKREIVIVVDGYSTGSLYSNAFKSYGIDCVHVRSMSIAPINYSRTFVESNYIMDILWKDDEDLKSQLSGFTIKAVLAGCEIGVRLAAHLGKLFGITYRNDEDYSKTWRDKYAMHEQLKKCDVRSIDHFKSAKVDEIIQWVENRKTHIRYPVVLKPLDSAGTDLVRICSNAEEVTNSAQEILSTNSFLGKKNEEVLCQEYLDAGEVEYCVNTVSYAGRHFVSEIIEVYRKRIDNIPVHDYNRILCPILDEELFIKLSRYIFDVLDALRITYGPAHSELMVVNSQPVLLETAARLPGSIDVSAYTKVLGYNQLNLVVQSIINPNEFLKFISRKKEKLTMHSSCVFLISDVNDEIRNLPNLSLLKSIQSVHSISMQSKGVLQKTTTLFNTPGFVFLVGKSRESLALDRELVRQYESIIYRQMVDETAENACRVAAGHSIFGVKWN